MTFARTRWRVAQHRLVAVVALATAASVLVPLASPAGATTTSAVTVTSEASEIFEGGTAVFTFHADPPPTSPLTVTYDVSEGSHNTLRDDQSGTKTVTIPANQASFTVQFTVRDETRYLWAGKETSKLQGYGEEPYCQNDNSNGLPFLPPISEAGANQDDPQTGEKFDIAKHGDKQCARILGDLSNPSQEPNTRGKVWVRITDVETGGKIGDTKSGLVQVRDRSLWKDRLAIVQTGGGISVAENGGTDTYTVALTRKPSSNVTVTVKSAKPAAATVKTTGAASATATLTFTPSNWSAPQTVTVTGVDDSVVQSSGKRTAVINHTAKSSDRNYEGATKQLTATVTDDDAAKAVINLSTDVTSVNEDVASAPTVTVTATLANGLTFEAAKTVAVKVADTGAQNAVKLTASPDPFDITIPAGQNSATGSFALTPADNNAENPDGVVTVSGTSGGTTVNSAKIALVDDETKLVPRVSISVDHSAIKENDTPNEALVTVTVNKAPSQTIDVGYTVSSDSAVQDQDYQVSGRLDKKIEFESTSSSLTAQGSIIALNDTLTNEGAETVTITLNAGDGYRLGANKSVTITIEDNTAAPSEPVVKFGRAEPSDYGNGAGRLAENWPTEDVRVMLDPVPASATTLKYGLSGTATLDSDYSITGVTSATATLSVPAYARNVDIPVSITDDSDVESDETVVLTLTTGPGYTLGTTKVYSMTIVDNDTGVTVTESGTPAGTTVAENGGTDTYTVVLDSEPAANVVVTVTADTPGAATVNKSGGTAGASQTLTFTPSDWNQAQTVTVTGVNDNVNNDGDKRTVTISHAVTTGDGSKYTTSMSVPSVTVTVTDDDTESTSATPGVTVSPLQVSVTETEIVGDANYTVVLNSQPARSVTIRATSSLPDGSVYALIKRAASPHGFGSFADLTFTLANWDKPQTVTVRGVHDHVDNSGDKRTVTISHEVRNGDGAGYPTTREIDGVTVDVTDIDTAGVTVTESGTPAGTAVAENGGTDTYTVVLDSKPASDVAVTVTSPTPGAATVNKSGGTAGASQTLTFTPSDWNQAQTVTVTGVNDNIDNSGDKRTVTISHAVTTGDGSKYTKSMSVPSVTVTVTDDDPAPPRTTSTPTTPRASFGSGSHSGGEASGSRSVRVPVHLSAAAPAGGLTVSYTVEGTAVPGSDYTGVGSSVSVRAGQMSATIPVTILDDAVDEDAETVVLTLNEHADYTLGSPMSTKVMITDNDDPAPRQTQTPSTNGNTGTTSNSDTSQRSSNSGTSSQGAPSAPPEVELRLGPASAGSISLGESSEMTVELERAVRRWVRVFIEIDSTASLTDDYTVDADVGDGWVSLGENPRRLTFDLPPEDTDARVRVTSRDSSGPDTSVTLSVTIGDRSFAASSVVTIVPVGEAEIVSSGDPDASATDDDGADGDGDGEDGEVVDGDGADGDGDGADGDGDGDGDGADGDGDDDGADGDGDGDDSDGDDEAEDDGDDAEDDSADVDDSGHAVEPESLGSVVRTDDGWFVLYTVEPGDTLRGIALTFYRDDEAWQRIYDANRGRRMSDGYTLTSADMIRAGWILRVPLPISAPSTAAAADASYVIYCVMQGDMLGTIAQRIYGDSSLYNRIVLANRGQRQADGQTFVHGDRIDVGWLLRIPVAGA
ncbi:Calx-beta domain-containing protein [Candidatus Poriferisodalis sp.]|uniref:Calx-beta domain-containing protein n=1 Tax=Candidatus Poriferisodalis sp. TaxID=3101277 RepID=UPI003B52B4DA